MAEEYGCKVCRVLDERRLEKYDDRLVEQWKGDGKPRKGYRRLARWLNVTLLRREMDMVGLSTLGNEAESKYDRLVEDDANAVELERVLEREGIDVDRLRDDFVAYGVVRKHLKECLGAEYREPDSSEWQQQAIEIATDHARSRVSDAVSSLQSRGDIEAGGTLNVEVTAEVECTDCRSKVPLQRALRRGYVCHCGHDDDSDR